MPRGGSSAVERYPSKLDVVGSIPILRLSFGTHSSIAQLVEQVTVNHPVPGSSPGGGAYHLFAQFMHIFDNQIDAKIVDEYYDKISEHYRLMLNEGFPPHHWYPTRNINLSHTDKLIFLVKNIIENNLKVKLTLAQAELQTWPMNMESYFHVHHLRADKNNEDFNSLLYLNDDFEGGQFHTKSGIEIKPVKGRLTFFDGSTIPHAVKKVYKKHRHTAIFWWKNTEFL